jgi:hypothetical protein
MIDCFTSEASVVRFTSVVGGDLGLLASLADKDLVEGTIGRWTDGLLAALQSE